MIVMKRAMSCLVIGALMCGIFFMPMQAQANESVSASAVYHSVDVNVSALEKIWSDSAIDRAVHSPMDYVGEDGRNATLRQSDSSSQEGGALLSVTPTSSNPVFGKMTFRDSENRERACSASLIDSPTKNLLLTAAHCVKNGSGEWYKDFVFFSDWYKGQWAANRMWPIMDVVVNTEWTKIDMSSGISKAAVRYDYAVVVIKNPVFELRPVKQLGANTLVYDQPSSFNTRILGYPKHPGDNEDPYVCKVEAKDYLLGFITHIYAAAECNGSDQDLHGMSGGPWIAGDSNKGNVASVTSMTVDGDLYGPQFDEGMKVVYERANELGK